MWKSYIQNVGILCLGKEERGTVQLFTGLREPKFSSFPAPPPTPQLSIYPPPPSNLYTLPIPETRKKEKQGAPTSY